MREYVKSYHIAINIGNIHVHSSSETGDKKIDVLYTIYICKKKNELVENGYH